MKRLPKYTRENLYDNSSRLSRLLMFWIFPLLQVGYQRGLNQQDVYRCCKDDDPRFWSDRLEKEWLKEVQKGEIAGKKYQPSISRAVVRAFGQQFLTISPLVFLVDAFIRMLQPLLIGLVVRYLSHIGNVSYEYVKVSVFFIVATNIVMIFMGHHGTVLHNRQGCNVRSALTHLMYKKVLRLSLSSVQETEIGQILNILATDLNRFDDLGWLLTYLLAAPIASVIAFVIVYSYMGTSTLSGFTILLLFIPFQGGMGKLFANFRQVTTRITDQRIGLMNEIVSAMKLIKVYCWETTFSQKIGLIREAEIAALWRTYTLEGVNAACYFISVKAILFACFVTHIYFNRKLDPEAVFVTMAIINAVRIPVSQYFPRAISQVGEASVTMSRINAILLMPEKVAKGDQGMQVRNMHRHDNGIRMMNYSAKWTASLKQCTLSRINMIVKQGELVIVTGTVGSGKTCLLHALLNELHPVSGSCHVNGRISYAPQESWCFGASIRENILLANRHEEERYRKVINVCGLDRDLAIFDHKDETFVGERGCNLSGGQKARVSLARAVYHEADVYLLDDPLSAVDPHVGNHIFDKCINGFLHSKTIILVTHQLQFLDRADRIIGLRDGKVWAYGAYKDLMKSAEFADFVEKGRKEEREKETAESTKRKMSLIDEKVKERKQSTRSKSTSSAPNARGLDLLQDIEISGQDEEEAEDKEASASDPNEEQVSGKKKSTWTTLWQYLQSGNSIVLITTMIVSITSQILYQFIDLWLAAWTSRDYLTISSSSGNITSRSIAASTVFSDQKSNIIFYSIIVSSLFLLAFLRMVLSYTFSLKCSRNIHSLIFNKLLRAKMSFFEVNPIGRILNRFTRDLGIVDMSLPRSLVECNTYAIDIIGIVVTAVIIDYYVLAPTILVAIICLPLRSYFIPTIRSLYRMDSVSRSPVYHHMSSTFEGLITIRAFRLENEFQDQNIVFLSDATACRFLYAYVDRAFAFYLELLAILYIIIVFLVLFQTPAGAIAGGDAGLILSQSLLLIGVFQYMVRITNDMENQMVSAERVMEYASIESEADLVIPGSQEDKDWPSRGSIQFTRVILRYSSEGDPVLKNLNFEIAPGQKIGIVGRTGAGKSSLISVLFRLVEPEGCIMIDGVDIQSLGLHQLRQKISIIPQDPSLFSGSVRSNLDPFQEYADDLLWLALRESHLSDLVNEIGGLDAPIAEGGSNLSVGQRQMLCMSRALLKRNKILVLDEATASVDQDTDEVIQKTIKQTFRGQTVLTIAHRLNTIIEMDKVLVMDAGRVVQFGEPHTLLKDQDGLFHSMVKQTGGQFEKMLHSLAATSHSNRAQNTDP